LDEKEHGGVARALLPAIAHGRTCLHYASDICRGGAADCDVLADHHGLMRAPPLQWKSLQLTAGKFFSTKYFVSKNYIQGLIFSTFF
jgi:hypothetical protein